MWKRSWLGLLTSWLVRSPLDQAVRVKVLARDIVFCSWERHFPALTVPLSTQMYNWVPTNQWWELTPRWTGIASRGSRNTSTVTGDKCRPDGPLGLYTDVRRGERRLVHQLSRVSHLLHRTFWGIQQSPSNVYWLGSRNIYQWYLSLPM